MPKRMWKRMPGRLRTEFNEVGGYLGVIGTFLAVVPLVVDKPLENLLVMPFVLISAFVFVLLCGVALTRAWPPRLLQLAEVYERALTIDDLGRVDPPPLRIGIVGPSHSGKTTLMRGVADLPPLKERTVGVSARVVGISTMPDQPVALIDGGGQFYADQFKVAEAAQVLVIILDHNPSDTEQRLSTDRLTEHEQFATQLQKHLSSGAKKRMVILLGNKSDIWGELSSADKATFEVFLRKLHEPWKSSALCDECVLMIHSNRSAADMTAVKRVLGRKQYG